MLYIWLSYIIPIFGLVLIAAITIYKDSRQRVNRIFFLLTLTIALWLAVLLLGDLTITYDTSLWAVRAASILGTLIAPLFLYLSNAFPVQLNKPSRLFHALAIIPAAWFIGSSFISPLVPKVELANHSAQPAGLGLSYTLVSVYVVLSFAVAFFVMIRKRKHVNSRERSQITLVLAGLVVAVSVNVFTGLILTDISQANGYSNLAGSLSLLAFVATASYAIVRYRLFDIRLVITRVIGYSITIGIVALVYSLFILLLGSRFNTFGNVGMKQLSALLVPTIFIALTFHDVERFVARHTRRIFYRDAYDEREVLDKLSDALISESNIDKIMRQSLAVLTGALRPTSAYLAVLNASGVIYHHMGTDNAKLSQIEDLLRKLPKGQQALVDRHENPGSGVAKVMAVDDIEILLRFGHRSNPTGVLLLGAKRSGTMYTKQDVALLRTAAKSLGVALDNAKKYEQIVHFADTLHKEVNRATSRLRRANKELKTLDEMKDEFIATASHQLRSPAASVHDALSMVNASYVTGKDREELIRMAEASSEHLVTVVRTMLNMARLQAGHFTIDRTQAELVLLTKKVLGQVGVIATQKGSQIMFVEPEHPILADVDVAKIQEALTNYIENAIKYSPAGGTVTVSLSEADGIATFEVIDEGMGVPEEERPGLFGKFYRATNARKEQPDGNGIGLYVVKNIAEGHGGEAYYRPGVEQGSVFGLKIPLAISDH